MVCKVNTNEPINESAKCVTPTHLSPSARGGEPEPGGVCGDAGHGGGGHEVAHGVRPPGVVVVLVHQVLPGHQLEEEHAGADERRDHRPARHKEVAGVVADHVVERQAEPSDVTHYHSCSDLQSMFTHLAPKPQDTAIHSKNMRKSKLIPLAAYSSNNWNT